MGTGESKVLEMQNPQLVEGILNLSIYHPPAGFFAGGEAAANAAIQSFGGPFAVSSWFWQSCLLLVRLHRKTSDSLQ
jgi:hypothetical protein